MASVLAREPDLSHLPSNLNPRLPELLKRCLEKNPKRRWQAIGDARAEMETISAQPRAAVIAGRVVAAPRPLWRSAIPVLVCAIAASALTGIAVWRFRPTASLVVTRFPLMLPEGQQFTNANRQLLALSPDGTKIVYAANGRLWVRTMDDVQPRPISANEVAGAAGLLNPTFSPDGQSVAYFSLADQAIKRVGLNGGAPVTVCLATSPQGMSWDGDQIMFGQGARGIMRVSASGGQPEQLVAFKGGESAYGPHLLPDGDVLFTLASDVGTLDRWDKARIVVQSLKTSERRTLVEGGSDARYVPTGHLVYAADGVLLAVPFDLKRMAISGATVPVVDGVRRGSFGTGATHFAFSATGSLAYVPGPASAAATHLTLGVFDRKGGVEPLTLPPGPYELPRLSPDRKRVAFGSDDGKEAMIWIYELSRGQAMRRLTFGGKNRHPIWSADGQRVAFQSDREGDQAIFSQRADGTGPAERLTKPDPGTAHVPQSWSPDGNQFLFSTTKGQSTSLRIFSLNSRTEKAFGSVQSSTTIGAVFSPDGRWIAYSARDTGRFANILFVQPFPATGAKYQISKSSEDGHHPVWTADGTELLFIPGPGQFAVVRITTKPTFAFGDAEALVAGFATAGATVERTYDIGPDGKGLLGLMSGVTTSGARASPQIQVVLNWFEELKARAPTR
jgi:serine/threonine-protein kinase